MPKSKSQTHITPDTIYDIIYDMCGKLKDELYDPCPAHTPYRSPIFFNGLYGNWKKWNYVNPMYEVSTLEMFVKKAVEQSHIGCKTVMLLPAKTDQSWFHDIILHHHYYIKWIRKRLKFKNNKHHTTGSHFLVVIRNRMK